MVDRRVHHAFSEYIENLTVVRTGEAIRKFMDLTPKVAKWLQYPIVASTYRTAYGLSELG